jgi:hypothetical protein
MIIENHISTIKQWGDYRKQCKNQKLPSHPERVYKSEWKGWADFLGKEDN